MARLRHPSAPTLSARARPRAPRWAGGLATTLAVVPRQHMEEGLRGEATEVSSAAPAPELAYALAATVVRARPVAPAASRDRRSHEAALLGMVATLAALITAAILAALGLS